ncbi:NRDE family protein [Dankookia sp. P2]|uniref:NRDE family protein n=1 Tax=Dankookia sp. P2 TaxID=3423955 RepID=UPI003D66BB8B
MCTVILLHRPGHAWPVLAAANRDEMLDRAWDPPGAWWPDAPTVTGGRDRLSGGTWMAANRAGVMAAVLNRPGSLGPAPNKRSRGELPLLALREATAAAAAAAIGALPAAEWRPFNMVVADRRGGIFLRGEGRGRPEALPLPPGLSMVTAHDPNDLASPRTARYLPRFRAAPVPDPATGDWAGWEALLADDSIAESRADTLRVPPEGGFGTVCASLLAIAADGTLGWRFAAGPAGTAAFRPVAGGAPPA